MVLPTTLLELCFWFRRMLGVCCGVWCSNEVQLSCGSWQLAVVLLGLQEVTPNRCEGIH